jgi:REP element-mobilizing transposase RayT
MPPPKAYFLTWTTYGTHLRGDAGESTDHARIDRGARRLPTSPSLVKHQLGAMNHGTVRLSAAARDLVEKAIREHSTFRDWPIFALSVRSNHVHLLINSRLPPERVMLSCKTRATRILREAGVVGPDQKIWTRHGSTRWINDDASLQAAYAYITQAQDGPVAASRYRKKPLPPGRG